MPGLRISGHLPASIVNGGGDRVEKVQFSELQKSRDLDLDCESGHTAYHRASVIDLYIYTPNFIEIGKTFSPSNVIRSTRRSRPNNSSAVAEMSERMATIDMS